jgi:HK97 family phage prohead protease
MKIERRFCAADKPKLEEREGSPSKVTGYASVFYNGHADTEYRYDDVVERIMPTAFDMALQSSDVRGLFNHDPNIPLGRKSAGTLLLVKDQRGLGYTILLPESPNGVNVREALRRGDVTGSSFGFRVSKKGQTWTRNAEGLYVREILSVDELFDVSPVTFPAYTGTEATLRAIGEVEDLAEFKRTAAGAVDSEELRAAYARQAELRKMALHDRA